LKGNTALHLAAKAGKDDSIKILVEKGRAHLEARYISITNRNKKCIINDIVSSILKY
jgi:ankyrin repeat protein